jgi:hypothetical protein
MPFGKFFHIFQRPAQLGASFYKDAGATGEKAHCRRCGEAFSSVMHVRDLIEVERKLGYRYEVEGAVEHYQWICPPCRRTTLAMAQGRLWSGPHGDTILMDAPLTPPTLGISAINENPQGVEDKQNLHF